MAGNILLEALDSRIRILSLFFFGEITELCFNFPSGFFRNNFSLFGFTEERLRVDDIVAQGGGEPEISDETAATADVFPCRVPEKYASHR